MKEKCWTALIGFEREARSEGGICGLNKTFDAKTLKMWGDIEAMPQLRVNQQNNLRVEILNFFSYDEDESSQGEVRRAPSCLIHPPSSEDAGLDPISLPPSPQESRWQDHKPCNCEACPKFPLRRKQQHFASFRRASSNSTVNNCSASITSPCPVLAQRGASTFQRMTASSIKMT